jgi:hypothetical protein
MSVEKLMREMMTSEIARALEPVHAALAELQKHGALVERLAIALGQPIKRSTSAGRSLPSKARAATKRGGRKQSETRECAVIGCGRPTLSRGYCAAHYQKFRMLDRTGRRPPDWVPDAAPASVQNIVLPRGRRAS